MFVRGGEVDPVAAVDVEVDRAWCKEMRAQVDDVCNVKR
jgi:hypothetical protein